MSGRSPPSTRAASTPRSSPVAGVAVDEGPRRGTSREKMAALPTLTEGGRLTAAVSSQISDAAAALLLVNERGLETHGLSPRARVHHLSVRGADPVWMLTAPIPATDLRPREVRPFPGRDRPGRDQRGVRLGRSGLAGRHGRRPGQGQRQRRRHRSRPSPGGDRRPADDDPPGRAGADRGEVRAADHVRGRRPGQRDDPRAARLRAGCSAPRATGPSNGPVQRAPRTDPDPQRRL